MSPSTEIDDLWKTLLGDSVPSLAALSYEQIVELSEKELKRFEGVTQARARKVRAFCLLCVALLTRPIEPDQAIRQSVDVFRLFHYRLSNEKQEHFYVLVLDTRHRIQKECLVSIGSIDLAIVHPRDVFRPAIREAGGSIICVHNHPSGDPRPSVEDRKITKRLIQAGTLLGIQLLDHVIIGRNAFSSFADEGWRL